MKSKYNKDLLKFYRIFFICAILPNFDIFYSSTILGFNLTGWAWLIILVYSIITIIFRVKYICFPVWIWLPWILYILIYNLKDFSFLGTQLTLQYLTSICVGIAASSFRYNSETLLKLFKWLKLFTIYTVLYFIIKPLILFGGFLSLTGASTVMTMTLLGALYISLYFHYKKSIYIIPYITFLFLSVLMVTRMGIAMTLAILPFNFYKIKLSKRIIIFCIVSVLAVAAFYSQSVQRKMFISGQGDIFDLSFSNENLQTSGRTNLYNILLEEMDESPWVGFGPRADLEAFRANDLTIKEAHNDYISIRYNYGFLGLLLLLGGFLIQFLHLLRVKTLNSFSIIIHSAALTIFIAWFGYMYTDNVLKYAVFFGNFHFALIGIIYSLNKKI